jgi:hypothetical protein
MEIPKLNFPPDVRIATDKGAFIVRRRSVDDYQRTLDLAIAYRREVGRYLPGAFGAASVSDSKSFAGTTPSEYRDMLVRGWPEGIEGAEGLDGLVSDRLERFQLQRNVAGAFANVPAHLAGHPASMYDMRVEQSEKRGLTLVVDLCFNCQIDKEIVIQFARKVMRLVAWLQAQQIEIAVYGVVIVIMEGTTYVYPITIREHGSVLQPERIAAMIHPSWLRRAWFSMLEYDAHRGCAVAKSATGAGYGFPTYGNAELYRQIFPDAYAVVMLPKPGDGDPEKTILDAVNLKLKRED